ncbi:hypothetical protein [Trinickia sp. EG282A]|uniref:hypothetical protein n=1 Tax=Trinickia sp. EG282A TaxID=3237013 RepID=UPI0034D31DBF
MKCAIYYCKSWFRAKKRPTEIWTEEQARAAHAAKKFYTVVVGSPQSPSCFLEVNDKFIGVGFLDEQLRESLYYAFKEVEPRRLFLSMATYREFDGDSDIVETGTTYIFDRDGTVKTTRQCLNPHSVEATEAAADVDGNYESWPEFGEYEDLIKVERSR